MRPDHVGLGGFDSHTFPPRRAPRLRRAPTPVAALALLLLAASVAPRAIAQAADSTRAGVAPRHIPADSTIRARDSLFRPPISPGKALLRSLLIPGWGQASLDRGSAGGFYFALSVVSTAMVIDSRHNLHLAQRAARDSFIVGYAGGNPATSIPDTAVYGFPQLAARVSSRRQQVEDWTALLVFTHLISGFDAFVAAHLWDLPAVVGFQPGPDGRSTIVTARFRW